MPGGCLVNASAWLGPDQSRSRFDTSQCRINGTRSRHTPPFATTSSRRCSERRTVADSGGGRPDWARPEAGTPGKPGSCLPAWTRKQLADHHLPDTMPLRPSLQDFQQFNRDMRDGPPELCVNRRKKHLARVAAWYAKRRQQQAWFARTGADAIEYRQRGLMACKRDIERELLAVMTSPTGAFAREPVLI
jgi:hypothetical protein